MFFLTSTKPRAGRSLLELVNDTFKCDTYKTNFDVLVSYIYEVHENIYLILICKNHFFALYLINLPFDGSKNDCLLIINIIPFATLYDKCMRFKKNNN